MRLPITETKPLIISPDQHRPAERIEEGGVGNCNLFKNLLITSRNTKQADSSVVINQIYFCPHQWFISHSGN